MTIADIYTGEGTNIRSSMLYPNPTPILSSYKWPVSHPIKSDFRVWLDVMGHLVCIYTLVKCLPVIPYPIVSMTPTIMTCTSRNVIGGGNIHILRVAAP